MIDEKNFSHRPIRSVKETEGATLNVSNNTAKIL